MNHNCKHNKIFWMFGALSILLSITLITGATAPANAQSTTVGIDDFEDGDASDWIFFGGNAAGGGGGVLSDRPQAGGFYLSTGWGGEGTSSGFYGGFFKNLADTAQITLPSDPVFNVWVLNQSDATVDEYRLEITIREDLDGDGWTDGAEDSFQLKTTFASTSFDDQWTLISAPVSSFDNLNTGGDGAFNGNLDEIVIVIAGVQGSSGATVEVDFDSLTFTGGTPPTSGDVIDDFESGLPSGTDAATGVPLGFFTFSDGSSPVAISTTTAPPAPVPGSAAGNTVLQFDADVASFAGFIHTFSNAALDTWTPQDWSGSVGVAFWLYGQDTGATLFLDLIENRTAGSTGDDAERWSVNIPDNFSGWQYFEIPFSDFFRKDIGNGAPNDGFTRQEMHGYAFGATSTSDAYTWYLDDLSLYGDAGTLPLEVSFTRGVFDVPEGGSGDITVRLSRPMVDSDPDQVRVDYATEPAIAIPDREYTPVAGTLTFDKGGPQEQSFSLETFDDTKFEGDERIVLRLSNPNGVELGFIQQASALIKDNDAYDRNLLDDFEKGAYLWNGSGNLELSALEIEAGDALARPGQDAYESILEVNTPILVDIVVSGNLCNNGKGNGVIPVALLTTADFDATSVDHTTVRFGGAAETHSKGNSGQVTRHEEDFDLDGDTDLLFHFRANETGYNCDTANLTLTGSTFNGQPIVANGPAASFIHDFAIGQDWTRGEAVSFWYYGTGSGDPIKLVVKENRAPDPGPSGWELVWSDEFDEPAGTPPDPDNWSYEIGDVTPDGKNGWGNEELQYYTADPANAATDGSGNLAVTLREADGSLECYYGTCEYTSARLISWHKAEFAYGRIESRLKVPQGSGIWPAFWSLGTDIDRNPWPGTGEIDFMEFVGRLPNEIFGTIHGPGYAGGQSYGNEYDFGAPVYTDYHTFTVEWEPDLIKWYVDDILYHTATPADVAPNEWVFNDPVFLLLNVAIGGNFGGTVGDELNPDNPNNILPQSMLVDYVRVYQGPDTAERWEASFTDNFSGWQQVTIPFATLTRSANQPAGAPDDGLTLDEVWGYGFELPAGGTSGGTLRFDQGRLELAPPPTAITVTSLANSGSGSLRQALADIAIGGVITFDPSLSGGTINLNGPVIPANTVTIDASGAPGISLNGGGFDRVLVVDPGLNVTVKGLILTNGYGFQLGGGVLNNGNLTLDNVVVTGNTMTTDAGDFWQGGAGIYNGQNATLTLIDSTVSNNDSGWAGGGVYSFFGTTTVVERSTISGNSAVDVGGGMRTLGNVTVRNSTISGNSAVAWHGGAVFVTDGVMDVTNSTIAGNSGPGGTAAVFVGTFGPTSATMNIQNSIVANNADFGCFLAPFGAGPVAINSLGNNVFSDGSCFGVGSDQSNTDPLLGPLADNGGPTQTHALLPGSPAIDAANPAACPATDQRGIARPQGPGCDAGAFELE